MTSNDPSFDTYMKREALFQERAVALHIANKAALFEALSAGGVTHVTVTFDGYGDSGAIENIDARAGDTETPLPAASVTIQQTSFYREDVETLEQLVSEAIETLVYGFLGETHAGWENNEGAYGEVVFDVAGDTITLQYNERIETSEYHEHDY